MAGFKGYVSPSYGAIQSVATKPRPDQYSAQREQEAAMRASEDQARSRAMEEAGLAQAQNDAGYTATQVVANSPTRYSDWGAGGQIRQPAYETQAQTALEARFAAEAEARRQAAGKSDFEMRLNAIRGMAPSGGGGDDGNIVANEQAARDAAFARAKDQQGQIARGALDSLSSIMSERGLIGGGYEGRGVADVVTGAQANLGETSRDIAMADVDRAAEIADRNYAGALTRRGQDLSRYNSLLGILSSSRAY